VPVLAVSLGARAARALSVVGVIAGFGAAHLWCVDMDRRRLPRNEDSTVARHDHPDDAGDPPGAVLLAPAATAAGAAAPPPTTPSGPDVPAAPREPGPWRPRADGAALRTGEAGSDALVMLGWCGITMFRAPGTTSFAEARIERDLAELDAFLARRKALGKTPWDEATFTIVGSVDPRLCTVGRDIRLDASPEASVRWYARARAGDGGPAVSAERVDAAARALEEYGRRKRGTEISLHKRLLALDRGLWRTSPAAGYFVGDGAVWTLDPGADAAFDAACKDLRALDDSCVREAGEIVR
jgi:hypothetical protein